jgi:adenosylcobinamide-GDP ribazoletransferase
MRWPHSRALASAIGNGALKAVSREIKRFLLAMQFLTRMPMGPALTRWVGYSATELSASARYFPWAGLLIGALASGVWIGSNQLWSPWIAAVLTTVATVWFTGAFHEDGLADSADALGGAVSRERALSIMKDSRIGTYGAVALILALGIRVGALASMSVTFGVLALLFAHSAGRASACIVLATLPYVRDDDSSKSKPLAQSMSGRELAIAIAAPLFCAFMALALYTSGCVILSVNSTGLARHFLLSIMSIGVVIVCWRRMLHRRLGGFTGDTLGAVEQLTMAVVMLTFAANLT